MGLQSQHFFGSINPYKHHDETQQQFLKGYKLLPTCENIWLHRFIFYQCPHVNFLFHSNQMEHVFPEMVQKTMALSMLPNLEITIIVFTSFDPWMSKDGVDTFALVTNYLDEN